MQGTCPTRCGTKAMRRCRRPFVRICSSVNRFRIKTGQCKLVCEAKPLQLKLTKAGCVEYETVCEEPKEDPCCGYKFPRQIRRKVEKPKESVIYELLEVDTDGAATFVFDKKLQELGPGRYVAELIHEDCESLFFDIEYVCSDANISNIEVLNDKC